MRTVAHGGNLPRIRRLYALGDGDLIDFSTSLNPFGPSTIVLAAARAALGELCRYPDPGAPSLTARLAELHGVSADCVLVAAGATELISLVARALREILELYAQARGDPNLPVAHLCEPTYGEYRRASLLASLKTQVWSRPLLSWAFDELPRTGGVFWTANPNNPTGHAWDRGRLLNAITLNPGTLVVVDEAFLPFLPDESERTLIHECVKHENILVLRSLTKICAMPGLRVGYAVGGRELVRRLRRHQDPWTVTAAAEAGALAAISESTASVVAYNAVAAPRLLDQLWEIPGLRPVWPARIRPAHTPPLPNFVLVALTESTPWTSISLHEALARRGLVVRECSDFEGLEIGSMLKGPDELVRTRGHIRIGIRSQSDNNVLVESLRDILSMEYS